MYPISWSPGGWLLHSAGEAGLQRLELSTAAEFVVRNCPLDKVCDGPNQGLDVVAREPVIGRLASVIA